MYNIKDLELVNFLKEDEKYISGNEMLKRAPEYKALSGESLKDWLLENQSQIPKEWQKYCIIFPTLLDDDRNRDVPCLDWRGKQWVLDFIWVGFDFYFSRNDRFVRPRESLELPEILTINGVKYIKEK